MVQDPSTMANDPQKALRESPPDEAPTVNFLASSQSDSRRRSSSRFPVFDFGQILLNRYRVSEELGRGAVGVVFKAWDLKLEREVAVKTLKEESDDPIHIERFRREIESLSGLQHPNIVTVHDFGTSEGRFWFVMDAIEGESLADRLKRGGMEPRKALELLDPIVKAVAHAHSVGIIHRDIKPDNILLDHNGIPYLGDFGLAYRLSQQTRLTATGHTVGTPAFMAPEQIVGGRKADERTDVYALGATLYECLTGSLPFADSQTYVELVFSIVNDEPRRPRSIKPEISRDVETMCLVCLEKDPEHRYQSSQALVADIERFLRGEAVKASAPWWRRKLRSLRRHWSLLAGLFVALISIMAAFTVVVNQRREFERNLRVKDNLERERETLLRFYQQSIAEAKRDNVRDEWLAKISLSRGWDWDMECFRKVAALDPNYWEVHFWRARRHLEKALEAKGEERRKFALMSCKELLAIERSGPRSAGFLVLHGTIRMFLLHQTKQAREIFRCALEFEDQSAEAQFARLLLLASSGHWEAVSKLGDSDIPGAKLIKVETLIAGGQIQAARKHFRALSKLPRQMFEHPTIAVTGFLASNMKRLELELALAETKSGVSKEVKLECQGLFEQRPEDVRPRLTWIRALIAAGDWEEAEKVVKGGFEVDGDHADLWVLGSKTAEALGNGALAKERLEKAQQCRLRATEYRQPKLRDGDDEER